MLACYNEAEHLRESFREIRDVLLELHQPFEVIFVDDVSRDDTRLILKEIQEANPDLDLRVILHETNRGRGTTVDDGFRAARGAIAGFLDVDLEVHARYIPSLVRAIERGADVATVRRIYAFQLGSLDRYVMSRGYSWLVRLLLGVKIRDTETGYKFFRRERLLPVLDAIADPGWFWDTEFMVRAERRGLRIEEIPGAYVRRGDKTSTVRGLRDSVRYFGKLLAFRRELDAGRPVKALREIGLGKALRFGLMSLALVPYRLALFPQLRSLYLRLLGARIGPRSVLHDVRFFNLYRRGLSGPRDRPRVLPGRRVPARPRGGHRAAGPGHPRGARARAHPPERGLRRPSAAGVLPRHGRARALRARLLRGCGSHGAGRGDGGARGVRGRGQRRHRGRAARAPSWEACPRGRFAASHDDTGTDGTSPASTLGDARPPAAASLVASSLPPRSC